MYIPTVEDWKKVQALMQAQIDEFPTDEDLKSFFHAMLELPGIRSAARLILCGLIRPSSAFILGVNVGMLLRDMEKEKMMDVDELKRMAGL